MLSLRNLAIALAVVITLLQPTALSADAATDTAKIPVSVQVYDACNGQYVNMTGYVHLTLKSKLKEGDVYRFRYAFHYSGLKGTDANGVQYLVISNYKDKYEVALSPDQNSFSDTVVSRLSFIEQGSGRTAAGDFKYKVTYVNGVWTVTFDSNYSTRCS